MSVNEERNTRVEISQPPRAVSLEITAESVLPDYRSEISQLLWVRPEVIQPAQFIGNGKADFSGSIRFNVLYVGPDGELYTAELAENYAFSTPVDGVKGDRGEILMLATVEPDAVVGRVLGPRKLSVRCRMHARVQSFLEKDLDVETIGAEKAELQRLCEAEECRRLCGSATETLDVSDTYQLEDDGDVRFVGADGSVYLPEVTAGTGQVCCRGEVVLQLLLCREGSESAPTSVTHRVPIEAILPLETATSTCFATAVGSILQLQVVQEDGRLLIDMQVQLQATAGENQPTLYTVDLFAPAHTAEYHYADEEVARLIFMCNRNFSIAADAVPTELKMPADALVCAAVADATYKAKECDGGRTRLLGEAVCHVLYRSGREYGVADVKIPFSTVLDGEMDEASIGFCAPLCRARLERGHLVAELEIQMWGHGVKKQKLHVLREARMQGSDEAGRKNMVICYPAPGDTLWSISKRYGVLPQELAAVNAISAEAPNSPESLAGVRYLMLMPEA